MNTTEINGVQVEIIEERKGHTTSPDGFVLPTNNCYAGIGFALTANGYRTGEVVAWGGDNAYADSEKGGINYCDLDDYLSYWDDDFRAKFQAEGILET